VWACMLVALASARRARAAGGPGALRPSSNVDARARISPLPTDLQTPVTAAAACAAAPGSSLGLQLSSAAASIAAFGYHAAGAAAGIAQGAALAVEVLLPRGPEMLQALGVPLQRKVRRARGGRAHARALSCRVGGRWGWGGTPLWRPAGAEAAGGARATGTPAAPRGRLRTGDMCNSAELHRCHACC
jgi:hypothetical protein